MVDPEFEITPAYAVLLLFPIVRVTAAEAELLSMYPAPASDPRVWLNPYIWKVAALPMVSAVEVGNAFAVPLYKDIVPALRFVAPV